MNASTHQPLTFRAKDFAQQGIHRETLRRWERKGIVARVGRGLYADVDREPTEFRSLVEASQRVPHGIICLISALRFHGLTTQNPPEVWISIDGKARRPKEDRIPMHIIYMSGQARLAGIEDHELEGIPVRIYGIAKTIVDSFKFRHKIGLDIALEALREGWRDQRYSLDELWHYAQICRVATVMKPYLESLV